MKMILEDEHDSILKTWIGFVLTTEAAECAKEEKGKLCNDDAVNLYNNRKDLPCGSRKN